MLISRVLGLDERMPDGFVYFWRMADGRLFVLYRADGSCRHCAPDELCALHVGTVDGYQGATVGDANPHSHVSEKNERGI